MSLNRGSLNRSSPTPKLPLPLPHLFGACKVFFTGPPKCPFLSPLRLASNFATPRGSGDSKHPFDPQVQNSLFFRFPFESPPPPLPDKKDPRSNLR